MRIEISAERSLSGTFEDKSQILHLEESCDLSFCNSVAKGQKSMKGTIKIVMPPGEGTKFIVRVAFDISSEEPTRDASKQPTLSGKTERPLRNGKTCWRKLRGLSGMTRCFNETKAVLVCGALLTRLRSLEKNPKIFSKRVLTKG